MNDLIFVESQSARQEKLEKTSHDQALDSLNKAKALVMAMWQGTGVATTEQMADYYEISADTVRSVVKNNRGEFESDGLKVLKGKDLKDLRSNLDLTPDTAQAIIWTPRAALRLGMLLRDSEVAKQVRTTLLDVVSSVPVMHDKIRALELELQLVQTKRDIATMHGKEYALVLLGRDDRLIEVEKPVIEIIDERHNVSFRGQTLKQFTDYLAKKTGIKFKTGADLKRVLEKLGRADLIAQTLRSVSSDYIPEEYLQEVFQIVTNGDRQQLIGE